MFTFPPLPASWNKHLSAVLNDSKMQSLQEYLNTQDIFFPPQDMLLTAIETSPLDRVKVVILGQDPYHDDGQAMGLSFSVPPHFKIPPSLKNIYREIETDLAVLMPPHGDLTNWAKQGVLLLNAVLSVKPHKPDSHKNKGWEVFTDAIIRCVSDNTERTVFILWGGKAKAKLKLIDTEKHMVLQSNHPSPLSANRGGFFGCKHFSKTNDYLTSVGKAPIDWDKI